MKRTLLAFAVAASAACREPPPPPVEVVRLYASPSLPGARVAELARAFRIADPRPVERIEEAEVAWLADPTEAIALGERAVPGSAPEQPGAPDAYLDPKRRFAPVGAVARVIVTPARGSPPFVPDGLRHLADPRVRGKVALARLDRREGAVFAAALELGYGPRALRGWLADVAANAPQVVATEPEVIERVASGAAAFGVTDSLSAGEAAHRGVVRIVFPDQASRGCVVIPTALVVLPGAGHAARRLSAWLAGPTAERVLADRIVGLIPLRDGASSPPEVDPAWKLKALTVDWSALAEGSKRMADRLREWPRSPPATSPE